MIIAFVWSGLGYLVPIIPLVLGIFITSWCDTLFGPGYNNEHSWPLGLSFFLSGVVFRTLSSFLAKRPKQIVITQPTGKEIITMGRDDQFCMLPIRIWGQILTGIGVTICVLGLIF